MFNKYHLVLTIFIGLLIYGCENSSKNNQKETKEVIINSDAGGRLIQAAMYPIYVIFLKGGDTELQEDNWVDKDYWASLDILEGKDKGKSVLFKLHPTREASIQPEWCFTAGGEGGLTQKKNRMLCSLCLQRDEQKNSDGNVEQECPVCYDPFKRRDMLEVGCGNGHWVCGRCYGLLRLYGADCPMCRGPL